MKKSLLALAVMGAFAGVAHAQTSVQIYGSFDGGIRHQTDVNAAGDSRTTMGSSGTYNSNRIGFKGVEDLGGGLNARFTLETGFNTGTGKLNNTDSRLFDRTASVGIGGSWGAIDLGRQYTVPFRVIAAYDPFNYKYTGIASAIPATAGTRYDNDIQYTGTFGPVTARAEYALGEVAGDNSANSAKSLGLSYANGPLAAGAAVNQREGATGLKTDHWTLGGAYKFGPARVAAGYASQEAEVAGTTDAETQWAWVGLNYAITPAVELTGAYYRTKLDGSADGKKDLFMIGATYALSKRTNFYAEIDSAKLEGDMVTVGQDRQTGVSIGINHFF